MLVRQGGTATAVEKSTLMLLDGKMRRTHSGNTVWLSMVELGLSLVYIKVVGRFYSCLVRQVNEAVRIEMSVADYIMNSKAEFHQSALHYAKKEAFISQIGLPAKVSL